MSNEIESVGADRLDAALRGLYGAPVPDSFQNGWMNAIRREESAQMKQNMERKDIQSVAEIQNSARDKEQQIGKPVKRRSGAGWNGAFWARRALPVAAALILVVGGVWAGGLDLRDGSLGADRTPIAPYASRSSKSGSYDSMANNAAMPDRMATEEAAYDSASYGMSAGSATNASTADGNAALQPSDSRKLVRTVDLSLRTAAFDADLQAVQELLASVGGYVENSSQSVDQQSGATRSASLSLRVPSAKLDEFLLGVSGIGRVVSRNESSTDMTVQYADNEARLNTLRQKITRLTELMAKAENVEDLIALESAIADTQYMIDSYETTQRSIDRRVDMSEVYVSLREDDPTLPDTEMSMGERLSAALTASLQGLGRFLRNVLVFLTMALPVLIPVAIVAFLLWLRAKRRRAK